MADEGLQEKNNENEHHRREIEPANDRQKTAYRPERRLGEAITDIADEPHEAVMWVDDVESDKPAQHGIEDQKPDIEIEQAVDQLKRGGHKSIPDVHISPGCWLAIYQGKSRFTQYPMEK